MSLPGVSPKPPFGLILDSTVCGLGPLERAVGMWIAPLSHLAFTRYCSYQYCMVYNIQTEDRKRSRILSNHRAIVLHQGGQCRWAGGRKDG